ncbi:hypothetical protein EST38_g10570 [Candolleomyces aberdarensis]|uniref:CRAL-TRIO domain-containing protein n=1 Tax=Candolleomyces aberdarensis TaxID=2316362 RepID=A0A4Q2D722_9AGAR|nr:hypothetical protein EST38_g10570 [Candolleomyces aberdarensis]
MSTAEKCHTPLKPLSSYHVSDPRAKLSESEQKMYDEVLAHFSPDSYALPGLEKGDLTDQEKFWLSRDCILRFLRASKWKTATAITRVEATLKWRREFGWYDSITPELIEPEAQTGKELTFGFDATGKPGLYMVPSRQNTEESPRQIQFAFWMVERCIDLMPPGVENLALLIDFAQRSKNPSIGTARQVVHILQEHYPERLGLACAINIPFFIHAFFRIVLPFVDPITRNKLKFNQDVVADGLFKPDMIMNGSWGGERDFEYDHDKYWKALLKQSEDNVTKWTKRWRELGAKIGISEWDYKGGDEAAEEVDGGNDDDVDDDDIADAGEDEEKREEKISVLPVIPALDLETESEKKKDAEDEKKKEPAKDFEKKEEPQTEKKESAETLEQKRAEDDKKDTVVQSTTTAAVAGQDSNAGGAVATSGSGGDGGAGGGDGGGAAE